MGAAGAIFFFAMFATQPVVNAADFFFGKLTEERASEAYAMTTGAFGASTFEQAFGAFLASSALLDGVKGEWSSRAIANGVGRLQGGEEPQRNGRSVEAHAG